MGDSSCFFVLFAKDVSLADAAAALRGAGLSVDQGAEVVTVRHHGVELELGLALDAHVVEESRELSERLAVPEAARCDRRFEVAVLNLALALDEYGTLQSVQETLLGLTDGLAWLQWNDGVF